MRKPKKLYHYCTVNALFEIIKSQMLWLSNCSQMNDAEESTWIEQYFGLVEDSFRDEEYEDFRRFLMPTYGWNKSFPFLFCLSEVNDSLGQWRAYADDGKGVAISFDRDILGLGSNLPSRSTNIDHTVGLVKVEYSKRKQKAMILQRIQQFKSVHNDNDLRNLASTFMATTLVDDSLVFKNPSFSEEKESRIIHTPLRGSYENTNEPIVRLSEMKFRTLGSKMTNYFELDLRNIFSSKLIPEIVIGPKSELNIPILQEYLKLNGLKKTIIRTSNSTYK